MPSHSPRDQVRNGGLPLRLDRRTLLRGVLGGLGVAIATPALEIMLNANGTALADGNPLPKRFGTFHWGGGIVHSTWVPSSTGTSWSLPDAFQSFAGLQDYLTLVTGTNHGGTSPGHIPARGIALSSSHDMTVNTGSMTGTYRGQNHPEPSIDALVADAWSGQCRFDLVPVGICRAGPYASNSSWERGGTAYNRHQPSPQALFDQLFGTFMASTPPATDPSVVQAAAFERSVLDAVMADASDLERKLGRADRVRMEQHLAGIRSLELRLAQASMMSTMASSACVPPSRPGGTDYGDGGTHEMKEAKSQLMSDLLAMALACDLTRVFSYEWSSNQSGAVYWEVGVTEEHHQLTHDDPTGTRLQQITRFIMQNLAYLARSLRGITEGADNLLDRTLILGTSEHATAGYHDWVDHPMVLVGKAGGSIRGGQHYRDPDPSGNNNAPKVLMTAVRAVDSSIGQLGQSDNDGSGSRQVHAVIDEIMSS